MADGLTCIVTVHGIGFQRGPVGDEAGYADELHDNLRQFLETKLGDDPNRPGPVYVRSEWPENTKDTEAGLKRIGSWSTDHTVVSGPDLVRQGGSIAHVALVYAGDEEHGADPLAGVVLAMFGVEGIGEYASPEGLAETIANHVRTLFRRAKPAASPEEAEVAAAAGTHQLTALVDHVGGYVARNVLRERVRGFVLEAIVRLAARPDVRRIVLNTHSNGALIAFDVVPRIPPVPASKLSLFVTAGNPLRKYVQLLNWGYQIQGWPRVTWINYYDLQDLVADQMQPAYDVRVTGDPDMGGSGLLVAYGPDDETPTVSDVRVSNVDAGRDAHDYWGNPDFCKRLSEEIIAQL